MHSSSSSVFIQSKSNIRFHEFNDQGVYRPRCYVRHFPDETRTSDV